MKRRKYVATILLIASFLLTSCIENIGNLTPPFESGPTQFVGAISEDLTTLDPHKTIGTGDAVVAPLVWEGLVAVGNDGEWKGVIAESWEVSEDGLTWLFHLRRGIKFHNGRELTSDDVVFSINRILDQRSGAVMRSVLLKIKDIQAVDKYTVQFVLSNGGGTFLSELGLGVRVAIVPSECVSEDGLITTPIGTGPFKFDEWRPGENWQGSRFTDYWGNVAEIDSVKFIPITDNTARFIALQNGEVDWIQNIPFDEAQNALNTPPNNVTVHLIYQSNTLRLNFNSTRLPLQDVRVRQALAYALDKEEINQAIFFGLGRVHNQPFALETFLHLDVPDIYEVQNLEKAKVLLTEAGYSNGLELTVVHQAGWLNGIWEVIGAQWNAINVKLNVEMLDGAQGIERVQSLDYDLLIDQQSSIFSWERTFGYFDNDSSLNWLVGGYSNETVEQLLLQGRNEADLNKAKVIYTDVLEELQNDCAAVFILAIPDIQAWQPWVKGFQPSATNSFLVYPGGGLNYATIEGKPKN